MSPRSKIIAAAVLFSSGGAAIKWCSFGAWQLAACRATLAMLTILILLPEARRGWSWRTIVVGFAYAATTLLYVQANKHTTAASAIFLQSTSPLFILLLAPLLLGEHATRRDIIQMAVMAAGLGHHSPRAGRGTGRSSSFWACASSGSRTSSWRARCRASGRSRSVSSFLSSRS